MANSMSWGGGGQPQIGGGLNFAPFAPLGNYNAAYANAASTNQQNYNNILAGYQQTMGQQQAAQREAQSRYDNLYSDVQNKLSGSNAAQQALLSRQYAQQQATSDQQLINRGLGNSTVQASVNRGIGLDLGLQSTNSANQFAQLQAQYMQSLGLAGAGYAGQAASENTALAGRQLDFMNSVQAPYPDARLYAQMQSEQRAADELRKPQWGAASGGASGMTYGASRFGSFSGPTPGYGASGGMAPGYGVLGGGAGGYGAMPTGGWGSADATNVGGAPGFGAGGSFDTGFGAGGSWADEADSWDPTGW